MKYLLYWSRAYLLCWLETLIVLIAHGRNGAFVYGVKAKKFKGFIERNGLVDLEFVRP